MPIHIQGIFGGLDKKPKITKFLLRHIIFEAWTKMFLFWKKNINYFSQFVLNNFQFFYFFFYIFLKFLFFFTNFCLGVHISNPGQKFFVKCFFSQIFKCFCKIVIFLSNFPICLSNFSICLSNFCQIFKFL